MSIQILDCTLRDGGYVNNWNFNYLHIKKIISNLEASNVDFIECGFLKKNKYCKDKSIFNSFSRLNDFITKSNSKYSLMLNFGDFELDEILKLKPYNYFLRLAFKKNDVENALNFAEKLSIAGFNLFLNPMNTISYSTVELLSLIEKVNKISPFAFAIVDTIGQMRRSDTLSLFYLVDKNLSSDISICFHSHNSLSLSFSNVQALLEERINRNLIIDSTLFGMGRGAGNLQTELITQYLNDNFNKNYDTIPLLRAIQEQINPIFATTPWGYSVPYRLAALNFCHPNYAKYLIDKKIPVDKINLILKNIPNEYRSNFSLDVIKNC